MDWNEAAEDLLQQILFSTPLPVREQISGQIRQIAEQVAEGEGKQRVGTNTVVEAWVQATPEALRQELPRQMERLGLFPEDYGL
ncbi:MAG: PCP reductase family protein [Bryobacteraceae bacterium]